MTRTKGSKNKARSTPVPELNKTQTDYDAVRKDIKKEIIIKLLREL